MKYFLILFIALISISINSFAQESISISGTVKSNEGNALSHATVMLLNKSTKDSFKVTSQDNGNFRFSNLKADKYAIVVTFIGFDNFVKNLDFSTSSGDVIVDNIVLNPGSNMLGIVTLESQKIQIKEDTISYVVDSTMYRKNDNVEAMIEARKQANAAEHMHERALKYCHEVKPYFDNIRYHADKLELIVDDKLWPLPKYRELLFMR